MKMQKMLMAIFLVFGLGIVKSALCAVVDSSGSFKTLTQEEADKIFQSSDYSLMKPSGKVLSQNLLAEFEKIVVLYEGKVSLEKNLDKLFTGAKTGFSNLTEKDYSDAKKMLLDYAVGKGALNSVKYLVEKQGVPIDQDVIDVAQKNGFHDLATYLQEKKK